eukprot:Gregarina_sp_Poly_1__280@NODE_1069_length_5189_cov_13_860016_g742_i0_p1_GENE_NODE_1069_length_5189_cov_13_860016_g742_i0NODE_1069_length_5189_cov_13_860016_g742_i0_p1_ORF_typecomplete_len960_score183_45COG4/PF08318_12/2_6e03COG4/PF08318_12/2_5e16DSHCT/PF08148_12/1_8e03DSHCT/PF08148_12/0_018zfC4H2/PF10146_9/1_5CorA/PF01544_18/15_NODE_1069_length_5189_cov_13_860016_g742_i021705049
MLEVKQRCLELLADGRECVANRKSEKNTDTQSIIQTVKKLDSISQKLEEQERIVEERINASRRELRDLIQRIRFKEIPAICNYVDQLQVSNSTELSQIENVYRQQRRKYEQQNSIQTAQERKKAAENLKSLRIEFKRQTLDLLNAAERLFASLLGTDKTFLQSLQSEAAIENALNNAGAHKRLVFDLGIIDWEKQTDEGRVIRCSQRLNETLRNIRFCRCRSGDPKAEAATLDEIEEEELETLVLNNLEIDDGGFLDKSQQAKNLVKVILNQNLKSTLNWNASHDSTASGPAKPVTSVDGKKLAKLFSMFVSNKVNYFQQLTEFFKLAIQTTTNEILHSNLGTQDPNLYPQTLRGIAESIADTVQALTPLILVPAAPCDYLERLMIIRFVLTAHYEPGKRLFEDFSERFVVRLKTETDSAPVNSSSVPLAEWTSTLFAASMLSKHSTLISTYANGIAAKFIVQLPSGWPEQLLSLEQQVFPSGPLSVVENTDPRTGFDVTRNLDACRATLINESIALEVEYLRRALNQAIDSDDVVLETNALYEWSKNGFQALLTSNQPSQPKLFETFNKRTQHKQSDSASFQEEVLSASTGLSSTLVDDAFFIIDGTLSRVLQSDDILGLCAVLNHSSYLLNLMLIPTLERNAASSLEVYLHVIAQSFKENLATNEAARVPSFTLRNIVKKLAQNKISRGRITSAECLPHALQNFVAIHDNIPQVVSNLKSRVEDFNLGQEDGRSKLVKTSFDQLLEIQRSVEKSMLVAIENFSTSTYQQFLAPLIAKFYQIHSWDINHEDYANIQSEESIGQSVMKHMDLLEFEWKATLSPVIIQSLLVALSTHVVSALYEFINTLRTHSDPKLISCLGALELEKNFRTILSWFIERSEASLRSKHGKLFEICDILATQSVTELWDLFEASTTRIWKIDFALLEDLTKLRYDLEDADSTIAGFLASAKQGVLFAESS